MTEESDLKTLARGVGRNDRASIARQVMKDERIKNEVLKIITKNVQKEMKHLTSTNSSAIFVPTLLLLLTFHGPCTYSS